MSLNIPAKKIYKFIDKFDTQNAFSEFVRSELGIKNLEINDIKADYDGIREQKYQTICLWMRREGRTATLEKLEQLKQSFDSRDEDDGSIESQQLSAPPNITNPEASRAGPRVEQQATSVKQYAAVTQQAEEDPKAFVNADPIPIQIQENPECRGLERINDQFPGIQIHSGSGPCEEVTSINVKKCTLSQIDSIKILHNNVYNINPKSKGYVLIINNNFKGEDNERIGAGIDVENLRRLWIELDCKVIVKEDLKGEEIRTTLKKVAQSSKISEYSYLVIFVMSHGDKIDGKEVILGADHAYVGVDQILSQFDNAKCKGLVGKPKLFFLHFCRGKIIDTGNVLACPDDKTEDLFKSLKQHFPCGEIAMADSAHRSVVSRSDMLISYATQSGFAAFENKKGSWFINAIAHIFMKYACQEHVGDLMIRVRNAVSRKTGFTQVNTRSVSCKEMSETCDLLTKKLFLYPGHVEDDILD